MDGTRLQAIIDHGNAIVAARIGLSYQLYRPTQPINPLSLAPLATLPAAFSPNSGFSAAESYGRDSWIGFFDRSQTNIGDILVGPIKTYVVIAQQALLPTLVIETPHLVSVTRAFRQSALGAIPQYGGSTAALETVIMSGWPASILVASKTENGRDPLPDDVRMPVWQVLMPALAGVPLYASDIITDELGLRYAIYAAELTPLGWRLTVQTVQT